MPTKVTFSDLNHNTIWNKDGSRKVDSISVVHADNPNAEIGDEQHVHVWQKTSTQPLGDGERMRSIRRLIVVADSPEIVRKKLFELKCDPNCFFKA